MPTLVPGIDYTVSAGVYTWDPSVYGKTVSVAYQRQKASTWQSALQVLGLSLANGAPGQPVWSWLQGYAPAQALGYSGISYIYGSNYSLTNAAELPNHNFEVSTPTEFSATILDADPAVVVQDLLTDTRYGAGWPTNRIGGLPLYSDYCVANGLFLSPVLGEQRPAHAWLADLLKLTNTRTVWSEGVLKFVPLGDATITGNGRTYTANTTPAYDLTEDDFYAPPGQPALRFERHVTLDGTDDDVGYNVITVEIENRANGYNAEPISRQDLAHIEQYGRRPKDSIRALAIKEASVGGQVAQLLLQAELGKRNRYTFTLLWNRGLLEPLDLVTLTDTENGLYRLPVRLLEVDEQDDGQFKCVAEDAPIGLASAPLYGVQAGSGFFHDYNASPGMVATPLLFEAPTERTTNGLEVLVAVTGLTPLWGGCRVWVSLDGTTYREAGRVAGGARYGTLTAAMSVGDVGCSVALAGIGGQMLSGTADDAATNETLCYLYGPTSGGEYVNYVTATLTALNAYNLTGVVRGAYDTRVQAHANGAAFARVDQAVVGSGPLDYSLVGKTINFKFTSFNVYGGGEQSLAEVTAYPYTVSGALLRLPPQPVDSFTVIEQPGRVKQFFWSVDTPEGDLFSFEVAYSVGTLQRPWGQMIGLFAKDREARRHETSDPVNDGVYTFAIRKVDQLKNPSTLVYFTTVLDGEQFGTAELVVLAHEEGWPGTKTNCFVDGGVLVNNGTLTWDDLDIPWDDLDITWDNTPSSPIVYEHGPLDLGTAAARIVRVAQLVSGTPTVDVATSTDGVTYAAWSPVPATVLVSARYYKLRWTVTGTDPVAYRAQAVFY